MMRRSCVPATVLVDGVAWSASIATCPARFFSYDHFKLLASTTHQVQYFFIERKDNPTKAAESCRKKL